MKRRALGAKGGQRGRYPFILQHSHSHWDKGDATLLSEQSFQFERHGYFVADRVDTKPGAPVFNRTVTLKDSWVKTAQ